MAVTKRDIVKEAFGSEILARLKGDPSASEVKEAARAYGLLTDSDAALDEEEYYVQITASGYWEDPDGYPVGRLDEAEVVKVGRKYLHARVTGPDGKEVVKIKADGDGEGRVYISEGSITDHTSL